MLPCPGAQGPLLLGGNSDDGRGERWFCRDDPTSVWVLGGPGTMLETDKSGAHKGDIFLSWQLM